MPELKDHTSEKWWVAHNNDFSVIHYGKVKIGQVVSSGQPSLVTYDTEQSWLAFLATKGINPNEQPPTPPPTIPTP